MARIGRDCGRFASDWGRNANGAGISADPTLTSAWTAIQFRLAASPSSEHLAPDGFPFGPANRTIRLYHRRSHRHPVPACPVRNPGIAPVACSKPRPVNPCWPSISSGLRVCLWHLRLPSIGDRIVRPAAGCFRVLLNRPTCIRPKPSASGPRRPRDSSRYLFQVRISLRFPVVRPSFVAASVPFR